MPGADEIMMEQFDEEHLVRDLNVTHSKENRSLLRFIWRPQRESNSF